MPGKLGVHLLESPAKENHTVPKVIDFPLYNMKCSGENEILRGIFRVLSSFPLHSVLYLGNLYYFLNRAGTWLQPSLLLKFGEFPNTYKYIVLTDNDNVKLYGTKHFSQIEGNERTINHLELFVATKFPYTVSTKLGENFSIYCI